MTTMVGVEEMDTAEMPASAKNLVAALAFAHTPCSSLATTFDCC